LLPFGLGIGSLSTRENVVGAVTWVCVLTGFVFLFMPGPLRWGTVVTWVAAALSPLAPRGGSPSRGVDRVDQRPAVRLLALWHFVVAVELARGIRVGLFLFVVSALQFELGLAAPADAPAPNLRGVVGVG
jgi:hypothetical protein